MQMLNCTERRRFNTLRLIEQHGLSWSEFPHRMGRKPTCLSSVVGRRPKRGIGDGLAREIERTFGLPENWLDQDHSADPLNALPRIIEAVNYLIDEHYSAVLALEEPVRSRVLSQYFEEAIDDGVSRGTLRRFIKCAT